MLWLQVGILVGKALRERQCMLEVEAWFVMLQGSVQCGGVPIGGSNFFNRLLKLTYQKRSKVTCSICY